MHIILLLLAALIRGVVTHKLGLESFVRARFPEISDEACFWIGLFAAIIIVDLAWHAAVALARWVWTRLDR